MAFGRFGADVAFSRFWHTPCLVPRVKPEDPRPDNPRPLGCPDPWWRWPLGERGADAPGQGANRGSLGRGGVRDRSVGGVRGQSPCSAEPGGGNPILLGHAGERAECVQQDRTRGSIEGWLRQAQLVEDPALALAVVASYTVPTRYLQRGGGGGGATGAIQGSRLACLCSASGAFGRGAGPAAHWRQQREASGRCPPTHLA